MKELNEKLRDLREDHDLTQKAVASYLGVSQQSYSNYEKGRSRIPVDVVKALTAFYKVSADYLLGTDIGSFGSINLSQTYVGRITMYDMMIVIQKVERKKRTYLFEMIEGLSDKNHFAKKDSR